MMAHRLVGLLARVVVLVVLVCPSPARAQGAPVDQATDEQKAAARESFVAARAAFVDGRHEDALRAFRESYDIVASPNAHLMVGNALAELGRHAEAHDELVKVVEEAEAMAAADPKYVQTADAARAKLAALAPLLATLVVEVEDGDGSATLSVAGQTIDRGRWGQPIAVEPGRVSVTLSGGGGDQAQEVEVTAGETTRITIGAAPVEPEVGKASEGTGDLQRTFAYVAGGVGALALVNAAIFGGMALGKHNDIEDACGLAYCPERRDDVDTGQTYQTVANVMVVVGLVGVSAGVVLYFTSPSDPDPGTAGSSALTIGPGSMSFQGRF